jgi:hypothetical protein
MWISVCVVWNVATYFFPHWKYCSNNLICRDSKRASAPEVLRSAEIIESVSIKPGGTYSNH